MVKKTAKKKVEKVEVVGPTPAELKLEIAALRTRIDRLVDALSKSRPVKGL